MALAGENSFGLVHSPDPAVADMMRRVQGSIVLLEAQPYVEAWKLQRMGAAGVIYINPEEWVNELIVSTIWGSPSLQSAHRIPSLPVAQIKRSDGDELRSLLARGPLQARISASVNQRWTPLRLAVARIPAIDPDAPFVLLGGHIDAWYHGATDEGASNATMLEIVRAFHAERHRLRRGLVVAWWPGHSNGRYAGSGWFADHFFSELKDRCVAYMNIDGVGQMGARRFRATGTVSMESLAQAVARRLIGEEIAVDRPGRQSDQAFNGIGLPLLEFSHTRLLEDGGTWWWHRREDTLDKVDLDVLEIDTELYVDALARLLASPTLPLDPVAEVEAFGDLLEQRQRQAGERFDLRMAIDRQHRLIEKVKSIASALNLGANGNQSHPAARWTAAIDLALVQALRPLHRVAFTNGGAYHPDPAVDMEGLPGLEPLRYLQDGAAQTDRSRLAEATLVRERNRIVDALDQASEHADRLLRLLFADSDA